MRGTGRDAAARWSWADLRRRWPALLALGVLAGVTGGLSMTALTGARRTESALDRLREQTNSTHAVVFSSQVGETTPDWDRLRARPEVTSVAVWDLVFGELDEELGGEGSAVLFASSDGTWLGDVNRPVVTEGRMYDPDAADEIVVSDTIEAALDETVNVGDTLRFRPYGRGQDDTSGEPATGPNVTLTVVGKVRTINQFLFTDQAFLPPGFIARYGDEINIYENADVRLRDPYADVDALQRDVNQVVAPGTPVLDLTSASRRVDTTLAVERTALALLAAAIALAGGLLVTQALGRSAGLVGDDADLLRAMGMTRFEVTVAGVLSHTLTVAVAVVAAFTTAVATSWVFPLGLGRKVDPDVGVHADWVVLVPGTLVVGLAVLVGTILFASLASRGGADRGLRHPSRMLAAIRRRAPLTVGLGTSIALEPASGRNRTAVRPALFAAIVGVLGVVGTLTIDRGIDESLANPARAGVVWEAAVAPLGQRIDAGGLDPAWERRVLGAAPSGTRAAEADRAVIPANGVGVPAFTVRPVGNHEDSPIALTLTSGRAPAGDDEAAVGPRTAGDLGVDVGDTVLVGEAKAPLRIVGTALFPSDVHATFDEGLWLTPAALGATAQRGDFALSRQIVLDFPSGTDTDAVIERMNESLAGEVEFVTGPEVPVELTNLRNVRRLPLLLAAFLALLGVAALSHVLVTSARRRAHDFAVLRAIGLDRRATRLVLNAQGTAIGLVGLVLGVPLGIAVGRVGWRLVTDRVPLDNVPPFAAIGVALTIPATILLANALALWPGWWVARLRPADALRTE